MENPSILRWTPDLSVGNEHLDQQHQRLFQLSGALFALEKGPINGEAIRKHVDDLFSYAEEHLGEEEEMMRKGEYPDLNVHIRLHDEFRSKMKVFREMANQGQYVDLFRELNAFVVSWLFVHIINADRHYAPYIRSV